VRRAGGRRRLSPSLTPRVRFPNVRSGSESVLTNISSKSGLPPQPDFSADILDGRFGANCELMHCRNLWVQGWTAVPAKARPLFLTREVHTANSVRLPLKASRNTRRAI